MDGDSVAGTSESVEGSTTWSMGGDIGGKEGCFGFFKGRTFLAPPPFQAWPWQLFWVGQGKGEIFFEKEEGGDFLLHIRYFTSINSVNSQLLVDCGY